MLAIDSSIALALLVETHDANAETVEKLAGESLALSGHALLETYSVLTRLHGDLRRDPEDARRLVEDGFEPPLVLSAATAATIVDVLSRRRIAGGAVYDAVVGLAAVDHNLELVSRDRRARPTYDALGVRVRWLD